MTLKAHWNVTEKVPEIMMSVNMHWVFLWLKRESPACARLRKGANYVRVFAWLCIVIRLTSNWFSNSGDLAILVTSFLLWKTKILYLLSGFLSLIQTWNYIWTIQKQFKCVIFFFLVSLTVFWSTSQYCVHCTRCWKVLRRVILFKAQNIKVSLINHVVYSNAHAWKWFS